MSRTTSAFVAAANVACLGASAGRAVDAWPTEDTQASESQLLGALSPTSIPLTR